MSSVLDNARERLLNAILRRRYVPDATLGPRSPNPDIPYPQLREVDLTYADFAYPIRIAHVSDLHFGRHSRVKLDKLRELLRARRFHLLVVSGDIVDFPSKEYFQAANDYLRDIRIEKIIAAGNHDRHTKQTLEDFLHGLQLEIGPHSCSLFRFSDGVAVIVFVFNSTIAPCTRFVQVRGFIHDEQIRWFDQMVHYLRGHYQSLFTSSLKIAVLHHHPIPVRDSKGERWLLLENSGEFLDKLSSAGINLILHGHRHCPMVSRLFFNQPNNEMVILSAGSVSESSEETVREESLERLSNIASMHEIEILKDRVRVYTHKYVNALPFTTKFKRSSIFAFPRLATPYIFYERSLHYKIETANGDLSVSDLRVLSVSKEYSGAIRSFRFSFGNTVKATFEELGAQIERRPSGGSWKTEAINSSNVQKEEEEGAVEYHVDVPLDPPPVFGVTEELCLTYEWPRGYIELATNDSDENEEVVLQRTDVFVLLIELCGGRKIVSASFSPEPASKTVLDTQVEARFEDLDEGSIVAYRVVTRLH